MTIILTSDTAQSVKERCDMILNQNEMTIIKLVGMFVASEPGVELARLYDKKL